MTEQEQSDNQTDESLSEKSKSDLVIEIIENALSEYDIKGVITIIDPDKGEPIIYAHQMPIYPATKLAVHTARVMKSSLDKDLAC